MTRLGEYLGNPGQYVADTAAGLLDRGPMGHTERSHDYRDFIDRNFIDSPGAPVHDSGGTNCAIFARGVLVECSVRKRAGRPRVTAITSWLGVGWFRASEFVPREGLIIQPGDVLYWCGRAGDTLQQWRAAGNGHVGIAVEGEDFDWVTAEGGGPGHLCRLSDKPKDVRHHSWRPLRGVWRPALLVADERDTEPAPPPEAA